ncbi:MAG: PH domain-containing protein [Bacteroidota bacterium]
MSSTFDKNLLPEFDSIKDNDEVILWTSKPTFVPFILSGLGGGLIAIAVGVIWIIVSLFSSSESTAFGLALFWIIGLLPLVQGLFSFLNRLLSYSNTVYAYSNKRVMMRTGFIGTDFKTIDYDKISDIEVTVNIIERIYNVGTIKFFSGRTKTDEDNTSKIYDTWCAIQNPYEIFKMVKQTSVDIKTDFNYPNALRPEVNPGYKTRYERKD